MGSSDHILHFCATIRSALASPRSAGNSFAGIQSILLAALACAWTVPAMATPVLPPGQEMLVAQMLGAPPSTCQFLGASIEQNHIHARYQCAGRPFAVELVHPSEAEPDAIRTVQFKLMVPPEAPPGFGNSLAEAIRERETAFRWADAEVPGSESRQSSQPSRPSDSFLGRLFGAATGPGPVRQSFRKSVFLGIAAGVVAFAIIFALAVRGLGEFRTAPGDLSREHEGTVALAVFAVALLYYALASHAAPFNLDTTRDVLSAHDCLKTTHACDILPPTSIGLFNQGGLFLRLLSLWLTLGLSFWVLEAVIIVLHSLSAVCVYLMVRRYLAARLASVTTALYLVTSLYVLDYPVVFNISVSLLPMAASLLSLMALISTGATGWVISAAATVTLAADAHVIFLMYLPWVLFTVAGTAIRPILGTILAFATIAITGAVQSFSTWLANIRFLFDSSTALPTFIGFVLAIVAGIGLRGRLRLLDARARCAVLLAAPTALFLLAYVGARMVLHDAPPMYAVPAQLGLCVGAAALLDMAANWIAQRRPMVDAGANGILSRQQLRQPALLTLALPLLAIIHFGRTDHSGPRLWSMGEVEKVARLLYERGYRFAELRAHLQTSREGLLAGLGDFEPLTPSAVAAPTDDVLLLRVPRAVLPVTTPSTWTVLDLRPGYAAVLRPIRSVLDREHMEACYRPLDGTSGLGGCLLVDVASEAARRKISTSVYTERMFLAVHEAESALHLVSMQKEHGSAVRFKVPIEVPPPGPARVIELLPTRLPWRIEAVQGVRVRGKLPATQITVDPGGGKGTVMFAGEVPPGEERHELYIPPPIAEMEENEDTLHALLKAQSY